MANINIEAVATPHDTYPNMFVGEVVVAGERILRDHLAYATVEAAEQRAEWLFVYALTELMRNL